ncbi:MAG: hypothetical protein ACXWF8_01220 [Methylobacter sp.]
MQQWVCTVCGYNNVCAFSGWLPDFNRAVELLSDTLEVDHENSYR